MHTRTHTNTQSLLQPLSKQDKFYMGRPTTTEYATKFDGVSALQKMGIEFEETGISIGGINFGNVYGGMRRMLGMGGSPPSEKEEL